MICSQVVLLLLLMSRFCYAQTRGCLRLNAMQQEEPITAGMWEPFVSMATILSGYWGTLKVAAFRCLQLLGFRVLFVSVCSDTDSEGKICCTEQRVTRSLLLPITAFNVHFKGWIKGCRAQGVNAEAWHFVFVSTVMFRLYDTDGNGSLDSSVNISPPKRSTFTSRPSCKSDTLKPMTPPNTLVFNCLLVFVDF